jgi:uncharacterized protein (TIGR02145 family)
MRNNTIHCLFLSMLVILAGCTSPTSNSSDTFELLVFVTPVEGGSMNPVAGIYDENTPVQLQATPSEGWRFVAWDGDVSGTQNPMMIRMTRDYTVVATFEKRNYELTISTEGEGSVFEEVVTGRAYPFQTTVRLTAQPAAGWQFDRWEGDLTGTENPQNITITAAKSVTAIFTQSRADFTLGAPEYVDETQAVVSGSVVIPDGVAGVTVGLCYGTQIDPIDLDRCAEIRNPAPAFTFYATRLDDNTTYFLRGYTEINGTRMFSDNYVEFTTPEAMYQKGDGVTDIEGNYYRTVIIGQQEWMAENLRTRTYSNGSEVLSSHIRDRSGFFLDRYMSPESFGNLYSRNVIEYSESTVCPAGWRVPSLAEWNYMLNTVGRDQAGKKIRSKGSIFWEASHSATNETGFSAIGSGYSIGSNLSSSFRNRNTAANYYTSTPGGRDFNWSVQIRYDSDEVTTEGITEYLAIRCVKDGFQVPTEPLAVVNMPQITDIQPTRATIEVSYEQPGAHTITERGFCVDVEGDPTVFDVCFKDDEYGPGSFDFEVSGFSADATYRVRGYAYTEDGLSYGPTTSFTTASYSYRPGAGVSDTQGNSYQTVIINNQEWMAENLRSTQFSGGTAIPLLTDYNAIVANRSPAYTWPDLDEDKLAIYGPLYHSSVAVGPALVCPAEWRIPTSDDLNALADYLGRTIFRASFTRENDDLIGGMLKSTSELWNTPNVNATDRFGFKLEPSGWINAFTRGNSGAWSPLWMRVSDTGAAGHFGVTANNGALQISEVGNAVNSGTMAGIRCVKE